MQKKWIGLAGLAGLALFVAGCGGGASISSSAPGDGGQSQSTAAVVPTETETDQVAAAEVTAPEGQPAEAAAATAVEAEAEAFRSAGSEGKGSAAQPAGAVETVAGRLELPAPRNELSDREYGWNQLLPQDAILPIYEPEFVEAGSAPYDTNELVIGVAIKGEAKAYAIGPLNSREMVNDTVGGTPVLVTW